MSLVHSAHRLLDGWTAPDVHQAALRQEFLEWIAHHRHPASRSADPHHVTASSLIVSHDLSHVALVLHPKFGRWLQTGGHIEDADRDVPAAALREATEETGIIGLVIDPIPVLLSRHAAKCWPEGDHLDVQFVAQAPAGATLVCSAESDDAQWWPIDALPESADDSVRTLVTAAMLRLQENREPSHGVGHGVPTL